MRAALFERFGGPIVIRDVPQPVPHDDAVLIQVRACGICRSDWHAWMGHDDGVVLPHVPGHELAGTIATVGANVRNWQVGDRVTVPFCCGCGHCAQCLTGNPHICDHYTQPGFTHWGAFAERVEIRFADFNLVRLPESIDFVTAASLGCRFATSFRAIVRQGRACGGQWVAIHGCGGVGLSAIMICRAIGARIIAVDIQPARLEFAKSLGADVIINASEQEVVSAIHAISGQGVGVSIDALGSHQTCWNSIACLAKRGRHVQVGLMLGDQQNPPIPMSQVIAKELEIYGSHGMQPSEYAQMIGMIEGGRLAPERLVSNVVTLEEGAEVLMRFGEFPNTCMTIIGF